MNGDDAAVAAAHAPSRVFLAPFVPSPSRRRLSSSSPAPSRAVPASRRRPMAWVSLQGRLIGAQEATSAAAVGGGLTLDEAAAWELFSPVHRVLIVAIAAVAAKESKRLRVIAQLHRSVDLRDKVLESMQRKLEELCEQMNAVKDRSMIDIGNASFEPEPKGAGMCICGVTSLYNRNLPNKLKDADGVEFGNDESFKANQQEERRMSDLSDFCSSVTSSVDIQLSSLAIEQDVYNLRKEVNEKDFAIKELTTATHAARVADSKRIMELEEIIRRKSMAISRLKKDMVVLEQKVIQLTRERRSSVAPSITITQPPVMANNLLYDMSSSSPSSSDPDSPLKSKCHLQGPVVRDVIPEAVENQMQPQAESLGSINKSTTSLARRQSVSPNYVTYRDDPGVGLRPKTLASGGEFKRTKRHTQQEPKGKASQKRWA